MFNSIFAVYGRGQEECLPYNDADLFNEDNIIMKTEQISDEEEELDDDHFTDMSDMEWTRHRATLQMHYKIRHTIKQTIQCLCIFYNTYIYYMFAFPMGCTVQTQMSEALYGTSLIMIYFEHNRMQKITQTQITYERVPISENMLHF